MPIRSDDLSGLEMDFKAKRRRSFGVVFLFMFLNGVEYGTPDSQSVRRKK